jgi:hypothetical protein
MVQSVIKVDKTEEFSSDNDENIEVNVWMKRWILKRRFSI